MKKKFKRGTLYKFLIPPFFHLCICIKLHLYALMKNKKTPVNVVFTGVCFEMLFEKVELAGIEPASKRGSNMLSTCLSPDLIFE